MRNLLAALVLFSLPPAEAALTGAALEEAVQGIISQRHPTDTRETWVALGPETPVAIRRMYARSERPTEKSRLLQGLGWFQDAESVRFLEEQTGAAGPAMVREAAIRSLGVAAGTGAVERIAGFLEDQTPSTRLAAARTLEGIRSRSPSDPRAEAHLRKFEEREPLGWVKSRAKGAELPEVAGRMTPVAVSASAPAPKPGARWEGEWEGVLVVAGPKGVSSEAVRFRWPEGEGWRGTGKEAKPLRVKLEIAQGGAAAKAVFEGWEGKAPLSGSLRHEGGLLKWEAPRGAGLLRKR